MIRAPGSVICCHQQQQYVAPRSLGNNSTWVTAKRVAHKGVPSIPLTIISSHELCNRNIVFDAQIQAPVRGTDIDSTAARGTASPLSPV